MYAYCSGIGVMPSEIQSINLLDKAADWGWGLFTACFIMVCGWIARWKWKTDESIAQLALHISENYVKKTDLDSLKRDIALDFAELKASNSQIIDLLLQRKIGTTGRRR